ncbi:MAG: SCO family protein [Alphaproteobacteria bacterium]
MSLSSVRIVIFALIGLAAALAALLWLRQPGAPLRDAENTPVRQSGTASIGGPFSLTDHHGARVTEAALLGHLTLIYFGYASCPDVCPAELQNLGAALDLLAAGDPAKISDVQGFLITVDPARDTVAALADYMTNFHPGLAGLTGSAEEIAAAARAYRVYFSKVEPEPGSEAYLMDHSNIIYLMGRDGKFLAHFGFGATAEEIAAKLREYQK